ncbi:MAG: hypothetical protein EPO21_06570 [Chloroflexota bacterium]|nr:MAG: hypothetical protein EPO21_06570 [Chloroflexota bacterium]
MVLHRNTARRLDRRLYSIVPLIVLLLVFATSSAGCGGSASVSTSEHVSGKPVRAYTVDDVAKNAQAKLPSYVPSEMQEGYQYALAHPDKLQYMPCYCGCGLTAEHKNNLDCYIAGVDEDGHAVFDNHASFCAICVEITLDIKRLTAEGKTPKEIRAYVDQTHGPKGPSTDTPQPPG